jgi:hypothetical protein
VGGDDGDDDGDYMDVEVDEPPAEEVPVEDGEPEGEDVRGKEPMVAQVSVPADLVCRQEHGPFRGCDNEDEDEEPVPSQEDDESKLAVEPAIHNPDPAMEELVEALSRLSVRTLEEHRPTKLAEEKQEQADKDDKKVLSGGGGGRQRSRVQRRKGGGGGGGGRPRGGGGKGGGLLRGRGREGGAGSIPC